MIEVKLTVELVLQGPVLTRSSAPGQPGVDSPMCHDRAGNYCFPYSLIRGRLSQSWKELDEATGGACRAPIAELLGAGSGDVIKDAAGSFEPQRARLSFTDFTHRDGAGDPGRTFRVPRDPAREAAREGSIQVIETPFPAGARVSFEGTIGYIAANRAEADSIRDFIETGLRWTTSFGAERTIGFGQLLEVKIARTEREIICTPPAVTGAPPPEFLDIAITPEAPFCLARRQYKRNLFESADVIPGGALRAAVASTIRDMLRLPSTAMVDGQLPAPWQELGRYFNEVRFLHAFPAPHYSERRPVVAPQSLAYYHENGKQFRDLALCEKPLVLMSPPEAPAFRIDWKDDTETRLDTRCGWNRPVREVRVHTKISREQRRPEDGQLYAYEMVVPQGHWWLARLDFSNITDAAARGAVIAHLRAILALGLRKLGKTKAAAAVEELAGIPPAVGSKPDAIDHRWIITLQTPAIICDPAGLNETSGEAELTVAYDDAFDKLSDSSLVLERYFARQSLAGGYLVRRFQAGRPYNPFLLTDAGSVFVLKATGPEDKARKVIDRWLKHGLELPPWAEDRYGSDYRTCPFLPEDGFGEVAVNLPCHTELKPSPEEVSNAIC